MHANLKPLLTILAGKADFRFQVTYLLSRSYDGPDSCVFVGEGPPDVDNFIRIMRNTLKGTFQLDLGLLDNENWQFVDEEDLVFLKSEFIRIYGNVPKIDWYGLLEGDPGYLPPVVVPPPPQEFDIMGIGDVAFWFRGSNIAGNDGARFPLWKDSGTNSLLAAQLNADHQLSYSLYAGGTNPGVVSGPDQYMTFSYTGSLPFMTFGLVMPSTGANPLSSPFSCRDQQYTTGLPFLSDVSRGVTLNGTKASTMIVTGNGNTSRVWINGTLGDSGSFNDYRKGLPLVIGNNLISVEYEVGTNSNGTKNFVIGNDAYDKNRGYNGALLFAGGFTRVLGEAERVALEMGLGNVYQIAIGTPGTNPVPPPPAPGVGILRFNSKQGSGYVNLI